MANGEWLLANILACLWLSVELQAQNTFVKIYFTNLLYVQVLARLRIRASGYLHACTFNKDYQLL